MDYLTELEYESVKIITFSIFHCRAAREQENTIFL